MSNIGKPVALSLIVSFGFMSLPMVATAMAPEARILMKKSAKPQETPSNKPIAKSEVPTGSPLSKPSMPTLDSNGDGKNDAWDRDENGMADAWDKDGDMKPDQFDDNGDGKPDEPAGSEGKLKPMGPASEDGDPR